MACMLAAAQGGESGVHASVVLAVDGEDVAARLGLEGEGEDGRQLHVVDRALLAVAVACARGAARARQALPTASRFERPGAVKAAGEARGVVSAAVWPGERTGGASADAGALSH